MTDVRIIPEDILLEKLIVLLRHGLDADGLAKVTGDLLGGKCLPVRDYDYVSNPNYEFTPNEDYAGAFDNWT